jgi:thioredoxin reductase (NADPH)
LPTSAATQNFTAARHGNIVVVRTQELLIKTARSSCRVEVTLLVRGPEVRTTPWKCWIRPDLVNRIAEAASPHFNTTIVAGGPGRSMLTPAGRSASRRFRVRPHGTTDEAFNQAPRRRLTLRTGRAPRSSTHTPPQTAQLFVAAKCGGRAASRWFIENGARLIAPTWLQRYD